MGKPGRGQGLEEVPSSGRAGQRTKAVRLQSPHCDHWIILLFPQLARGFEAIIIDLSTGAGGMEKLGGLMAIDCVKQGR